jgi:hypothetical protein
MFVKQLGTNRYGIYADEAFRLRVGTAERLEREWYFQAAAQYGGKWAFGVSMADAVEQTGAFALVRAEDRIASRRMANKQPL